MKTSLLRLIVGIPFIFINLNTAESTTWEKNDKLAYCVSKSDKKVMRILIVVDRFPWYTKQVIINQITGLLDRGHDVYVYSKVQMKDYRMDDSLKKYLVNRVFYEKLPSDLGSYDIIIFQYGSLGREFYNIRKKFNLKAKLVTFFRGSDVTSPKERNQYLGLFQEGDLFLSICEYYKFRLILLGCDPNKMLVQYSGVDCSKFKLKKREFSSQKNINIISVGRLTEKKGFPYIINAVANLLKQYPNISYTIVGDGRDRKGIEQQIKKLGIANKVKLLGWQTQDEIKELLYSSHIFLSPSVTTRKGDKDAPINVLKEAMLTGLPVISSHHGGIIELIDRDISGLLVPERDVSTLIDKVKYLLTSPKKCEELGEAGRKKVKQLFDMEKLNDQLEKVLLNLLGDRL